MKMAMKWRRYGDSYFRISFGTIDATRGLEVGEVFPERPKTGNGWKWVAWDGELESSQISGIKPSKEEAMQAADNQLIAWGWKLLDDLTAFM